MARRAPTGPPTEAGAWGRLLNWFSVRPRTEQETAQRLARWGVEPDARERLTQRLREIGLLDDRAFAEAFARELRGKGFRGPALRAKLALRGIDRVLVDAVEAGAPEEDGDALLALARRRLRTLPADEDAALRRLTGYLQRRGLNGGRALEIAREVLAER